MKTNLRWAWLPIMFAAAVHPPAADPGVWTTHGRFDGAGTAVSVNSVAADPSSATQVFCAASDGEIFVSNDREGTWLPLHSFGGGFAVGPIAVDPGTTRTIFAALQFGAGDWFNEIRGALYRTTDAGVSWAEVGSGLLDGPIAKIVPDPSISGNIYVTDSGYDDLGRLFFGGVFRSTDGGDTFGAIGGDFLPEGSVLAVDPFDAGVAYAIGEGNFTYESSDFGATWKSVPGSSQIPGVTLSLAVLPGSTSILLAAQYINFSESIRGVVVYRSTDDGVTWTSEDGGEVDASAAVLAIAPHAPNRIFLATADTIFESDDTGISWRSISATLPNVTVFDLAIDPSGQVLHAATSNGVYDYEIPERAVSIPGLAPVGVGSIGRRP